MSLIEFNFKKDSNISKTTELLNIKNKKWQNIMRKAKVTVARLPEPEASVPLRVAHLVGATLTPTKLLHGGRVADRELADGPGAGPRPECVHVEEGAQRSELAVHGTGPGELGRRQKLARLGNAQRRDLHI